MKLPAWPKDDYPNRTTAEAYAGATPSRIYASVDRQRIMLAREWLVPVPCPNCEQPMAVVDAIHVQGDDFVCSVCEAKLRFTVPLFAIGSAYWHWVLAPGQINVDRLNSQDPENPGLESDEKFLRKFGNEGPN